MEEELVNQLEHVLKDLSKMDYYAIPYAEKDSMETDLYAGKTAPLTSLILELIAPSPLLMEEVPDMLFGMKINAIEKTLKDVKNGELCGILSVGLDSTTLLVVYVPPIAHLE